MVTSRIYSRAPPFLPPSPTETRHVNQLLTPPQTREYCRSGGGLFSYLVTQSFPYLLWDQYLSTYLRSLEPFGCSLGGNVSPPGPAPWRRGSAREWVDTPPRCFKYVKGLGISVNNLGKTTSFKILNAIADHGERKTSISGN